MTAVQSRKFALYFKPTTKLRFFQVGYLMLPAMFDKRGRQQLPRLDAKAEPREGSFEPITPIDRPIPARFLSKIKSEYGNG
jgi:hypothetical protein